LHPLAPEQFFIAPGFKPRHYMLKLAFYLGLTGLGALATFWDPLYGAVACVLAYLFNPAAIAMDTEGFRFQLWITIAFLTSVLLHRPKPTGAEAPSGHVLAGMWIFVALCSAIMAAALRIAKPHSSEVASEITHSISSESASIATLHRHCGPKRCKTP